MDLDDMPLGAEASSQAVRTLTRIK